MATTNRPQYYTLEIRDDERTRISEPFATRAAAEREALRLMAIGDEERTIFLWGEGMRGGDKIMAKFKIAMRPVLLTQKKDGAWRERAFPKTRNPSRRAKR